MISPHSGTSGLASFSFSRLVLHTVEVTITGLNGVSFTDTRNFRLGLLIQFKRSQR